MKALLISPLGGGASHLGFPSGPLEQDYSACAERVRRQEDHGPSAQVNELFFGLGEKLSRAVPEEEQFQVAVPDGFGRAICGELRSIEARAIGWVSGQASGDLGRTVYVPKGTRQWLLDKLFGHALQNHLGIVALDAGFFAHAELEDLAARLHAAGGSVRSGDWERRLAEHEDLDFAAMVKEIRATHSLTQAELAKALRAQNPDSSFQQAHISRWENGSTPSETSIQALRRFANSL